MKKDLKASEIQKLLRSGVSKNQLSSDYEVDEKLLDSFSKMVKVEKKFIIEDLKNYYVNIDGNLQSFSSLVNTAAIKSGEHNYNPIWLASKDGHQPWHITINLSSVFPITFLWNPLDRHLLPLDEYAKQLLANGFIEFNEKTSSDISDLNSNQKTNTSNDITKAESEISSYNPFEADQMQEDRQALTQIIDFSTIRQDSDQLAANVEKNKLSDLVKEKKVKNDEVNKFTEYHKKPDNSQPDDNSQVDEKLDKTKTDKKLAKSTIKDNFSEPVNNSTTSIDKAEVGKGKIVKTPSERIPVPSWDDIILGGK
ncbi:MAG: DUF3071 domain-containing protein [Bifidobacteriaceae bacterium]|jgi:hypothetical protein|nr:DUF3071 domain-containing protein [Bifidobacteriaceae bacterium]